MRLTRNSIFAMGVYDLFPMKTSPTSVRAVSEVNKY